MKKSIILAAIMAITFSASAQLFDFSSNNGRFDLGVQLGQVGIDTKYTNLGWGASLSCYGVYVDFLSAGPKYKYDNHVEVGANAQVPDSTTMTANIGYQIPIFPWLRIMPLIGFSRTTSGYTDFSTVNAETTNSGDYVDVQLYHDYINQKSWNTLNYGGGLVIQPVKWVSIYGVYTIHAIYGGLSLNFNAFRN
jgi:hypothetical protein